MATGLFQRAKIPAFRPGCRRMSSNCLPKNTAPLPAYRQAPCSS